jgi:dolichyl-phosphate beta-glucosyltransferase
MMENVRPELSVVIPAYNEAARLPRTIERVQAFLAGRPHEIVVVDDGSTDGTVEAAQAAAREALVVLRNEGNRGKGYAVRRGMLAARAPRRLMSDADLSTPIEELGRLEPWLEKGHDVAIGSRALAGSRVEIRQPWYRENMGRVFNVCVRALAVPGVRDTQCGFKLFTARAAEAVFAAARLDGFSFDVEALFIARQLGYRIAEVPVVWRNDAATRVGLLGGFQAFPDLLRIRLNDWRGYYAPGRASAAGGSPV